MRRFLMCVFVVGCGGGQEVVGEVDATSVDAGAVEDGPAGDAGGHAWVLGPAVPAVWSADTSQNSNASWYTLASLLPTAEAGRVAYAISNQNIAGAGTYFANSADRTGVGSAGVSLTRTYASLRPDAARVVLALVRPDPGGQVPSTRAVIEIDLATGGQTRIEVAGIGPGWFDDAVRDGAGFLVGAGDTAWRVASDGAVVTTYPLTGLTLAAFDRGDPRRVFAYDSSHAVVIVDLVAGTRTTPATPAGLTDATLVAGSPPWIAGTIGGAPVVAPLGSTVPTALPPSTYRLQIDAHGRLIAVTAASARTLVAFRIDDALFAGLDGATRLDPSYGGDGQAELEACITAPCAPDFHLHDIAVAANGSIAVGEDFTVGPAGFERAATRLWWFDAP